MEAPKPESTWTPPSEFAVGLAERYPGLTCPPRWGLPRRPEYPTYGPAVARVSAKLGFPAMPHQRYVWDVGLEVDPVSGILCYREVGQSIPRQQGKTISLLGVIVHRLMKWTRQRVLYSAQTGTMARSRFLDEFLETLDQSELSALYVAWKLHMRERLLWKSTRSRFAPVANTPTAGHGPPLDLGVLDEIFAHIDDRMEAAFTPAMATRPMAQLWWASAAGTEQSTFLEGKREIGRAAVEQAWAGGPWPMLAYFEWYTPPGVWPSDSPATWRMVMPALCPAPPCRCDPAGVWRHTITEQTVRADKQRMKDPDEFDRGYLNRTRRKVPPPDPNVPVQEWLARVDRLSRPGRELAFGIDVTPLRDRAAILAYSPTSRGRPAHGELVDARPGTAWVARAMVQLKAIHNPVAIGLDAAPRSPGSVLVEDLAAVGIREPEDPEKPHRGDLWVPKTTEFTTACADLSHDIVNGRIAHADQQLLNVAWSQTVTRVVGDAWAFARRKATGDISPVVGLTVARGAYLARVDTIVPETGEAGAWWV